jgi:hypothetical protein
MPRRGRQRPSRNGAEGALYRRIVKAVISRDFGVCHICGHPGANSADHLVPVTERPDLALNAANLKAAHGSPRPCPTCSAAAVARGGKPVYCNEVKQGWSTERARRLIEQRTGLALVRDKSQPGGEREW